MSIMSITNPYTNQTTTMSRTSYAQLAEKRYIPTSHSTKSIEQRPQSANPSNCNSYYSTTRILTPSNLDNKSRNRQNELIEHLKAQCKKYKNKSDILLKEKSIIDHRYCANLVKCEDWKMKAKSTELNLNHLTIKFKNELKEIKMNHQREICRMNLISENKLSAIQNKLDQQEHLMKKLKNINTETVMNLETVQNKYDEAKTYQSSLENKLQTSMKRAIEVQESLSQKLNNFKNDSHQNNNKLQNDMDRVNNLLSIKESDIKFLRTQLNNERDANHKKQSNTAKKHREQIDKLQNEIGTMSKELQCIERQREEFARNSQICSDSLNKALSEYSSERESLSRLHLIEMQRKDGQIREFKKTIGRQQDRLHKLLDRSKANESEVSELKQMNRNLQHDLSKSNGATLRITEEIKEISANENEIRGKMNKMERVNVNLLRKCDTLVQDLSTITTQRDDYKNQMNKLKYCLNAMEMDQNKIQIKSDTAMELNEALKMEMEHLRKGSISMSKYVESTEKCQRLSSDLNDCYQKIEKLSMALDSTKCDLNKLSSQSIPIAAYEHLSGNINKLETENIALNKRMNAVMRQKDELEDEVNDKRMTINSYQCTQDMLRERADSFKESMRELTKTNRQMSGQRKDLKKKYKKIKGNLDDLSKTTQINQDLVRSNKFLRKEMGKLVNQKAVKLSRECANPRCNSSKGTYLKIHPKTLNALKKACNF